MKIKMLLMWSCLCLSFAASADDFDAHAEASGGLFQTASRCIACHSDLRAANGEDVSIGYLWRASMMANSARDPYWHAAVRREVTDHPAAQAAIEDKCSTCHMPMAHVAALAQDVPAEVFSNIVSMMTDPDDHLAADGVSCTVCHQIQADNFGREDSFTGGFLIDTAMPAEQRQIYGPHEVDAGRQRVMASASGFSPTGANHLKQSELCATCHTLYTHALDDQGREVGQLAEQVPYLEWLESDYRQTQSCQDCHMPVLPEDTPISSVLGQPRPEFSQHVFRGGNSFMLTVLNKYRGELGVTALPQELDRTIRRTRDFLESRTATLGIDGLRRDGGELVFEIAVANLAGHKLPTAYPSRRAWLHVAVRDARGRLLFESGALEPGGAIAGNANDADPAVFEPHYEEITQADQVQIYESILGDWQHRVTTGLLNGVTYLKDNRIPPVGFDKQDVDDDIRVAGRAEADADFAGGGDRVRYRIPVEADGPLSIDAELRFQSVGYRWAQNLRGYAAAETERFVRYYDETIDGAAVTLARDSSSTD